jgi:hypothetical protein
VEAGEGWAPKGEGKGAAAGGRRATRARASAIVERGV